MPSSAPAGAPLDLSTLTYEALSEDPYPIFARLRAESPIVHVPDLDEWYITRWDDCAQLGAISDDVAPGRQADEDFFGAPNILRLDGAAHKALRMGIDTRIRPRAISSYVDTAIRPIVAEYVARIRPQGKADLTTELFEQISVRIVGNQLGMKDVDDETLVRWFQVLSSGHATRDGAEADVLVEIEAYLRNKIAAVTAEADDSIISHMVHVGQDDPRTYDELAPTLRVIILGGFQEPGHAVANAFYGLFTRPEQLAELVADPEKYAGAAFNEGLRWLSPVSGISRTTRREVTIRDVTIPANSSLTVLIAAANRDPEQFEDPDSYDMHRMLQAHAAFGFGEHFCSGNFLARQLGQIMIEEVVRTLPGLRPDPDLPSEVSGYGFRAATHLPALWNI
ncbi:MAG TPA: cytochrome P450 [Pseudolysinimonas sp.]|nr:cytochrome P450 [Pseudolysinimonas sp.]